MDGRWAVASGVEGADSIYASFARLTATFAIGGHSLPCCNIHQPDLVAYMQNHAASFPAFLDWYANTLRTLGAVRLAGQGRRARLRGSGAL